MLSRLNTVLERVHCAIARESGVNASRPFIRILLNMTEILVRYTVLIKQDGKSAQVLSAPDMYQFMLAKDDALQQATANFEHHANEIIGWLLEYGECSAMSGVSGLCIACLVAFRRS